jgi:hypothetical protein
MKMFGTIILSLDGTANLGHKLDRLATSGYKG